MVTACAAFLTGCTFAEKDAENPVAALTRAAQPGVSSVVGPAGGRVAVPGGPVIDVPAGSVAGNGRLEVRGADEGRVGPVAPSAFLGVRGAYELTLQDARLTGPVRLSFPVQMQPLPAGADDDAAAVLGHYDETSQAWKIVPAEYDPDRGVITAEVYELSWWNPFVWDFSALRNAVAVTYRSALAVAGRAPECQHEAEVRQTGAQVSSTGGERVRWCYGLDEGRPVLKVSNRQGYPVSVELPRDWRVRNRRDGVRLPRGLDALLEPGEDRRTLVLSGGSSVELYPGVLSPSGSVAVRSSSAGYLAMALALGLDTFGMAATGVPGTSGPLPSTSHRALSEVLEGDCLERYPHRSARTLAEAETLTLQAHSLAFRCLKKSWKSEDDFTGVGLTWLAEGIEVLIDGVTGVPDAAVFSEAQTIQVEDSVPQLFEIGSDPR